MKTAVAAAGAGALDPHFCSANQSMPCSAAWGAGGTLPSWGGRGTCCRLCCLWDSPVAAGVLAETPRDSAPSQEHQFPIAGDSILGFSNTHGHTSSCPPTPPVSQSPEPQPSCAPSVDIWHPGPGGPPLSFKVFTISTFHFCAFSPREWWLLRESHVDLYR